MFGCDLWPRVAITFCLALNRRLKPELKTRFNAGFEQSLIICWRLSCGRCRSRGISPASICRLGTGDVRKAPRRVSSAAFGPDADGRVKAYTTQPKLSFDLTCTRYSLSSVALSAPQSLCATTHSRFTALKHPSLRYFMWAVKVSFLSKTRPKKLVSVTTGMGEPQCLRSGSARVEFWLLKCTHTVFNFENWNPYSLHKAQRRAGHARCRNSI